LQDLLQCATTIATAATLQRRRCITTTTTRCHRCCHMQQNATCNKQTTDGS